ncbi:MAG TPA: hypothetical protein VMZ03_04195 [Chitinophagaceae bacterium]|nr:hypothetical protein [Chitinophagaceae bacterium]
MATKDLALEPDEKIIDTWPLFYSPPGGEIYEIRCTITNKRLMYGGQGMRITADLTGLVDLTTGNREWLVIPKQRIRQIETKRSYLEKRIILTLDDGHRHEFSYGALNIDKLVEAITSGDGNTLIQNI